jgi:hypothetical protein
MIIPHDGGAWDRGIIMMKDRGIGEIIMMEDRGGWGDHHDGGSW